MEETLDPLLGRLIAGKLELLRLIGSGAMGRVYRAHHVGLDKPVAIKVLLNASGPNDAQALRFQAEARAASRLEHPNSVQILDFGQDRDGLLYIAMEYLEGIDLQEVLRHEDRLPSARVAYIMSQVFSALGAAHQKGVIHRDMKPGNIMLIEKSGDEGRIKDFVKVCDFGLAKILDEDSGQPPLTRQGAIFGTPAYMSPEQARGAVLDGRSDIYSCGIIMFKMLTGRTPFRAESPTAVLLQHIQNEPPPPSSLAPNIHPELEALVLRCLQKDPNDRIGDARDIRDALRDLLRAWGLESPGVTGVGPMSFPEASPPRSPTATKTESMRPHEVADDNEKTALAHPAARAPSHVRTVPAATMHPDTMKLPLVSSVRPPAASSNVGLAAIPGVIALLAIGGLVAYLASRPTTQPAPTLPSVVVAPPPPAVPAPPTALGAPDPVPSSKDDPIDSGAPLEVGLAPDARGATKRSPKRAPTLVSSPPPPSAPPTTALAAPTQAPPPPIASPIAPPTPPPAAMGPTITAIEELVVDGGVSKKRSEEGLLRRLDAMSACVDRALAQSTRGSRSGKVRLEGKLDERGRLRNLSAAGDLAIGGCIEEALAMAKLPVPDTGAGRIAFVLTYGPKGD